MKPTLQVRLSQHLALTPQLQQSIRLLQLSTLELHQEVEQMLDQNPFLESEDEGPGFEFTSLDRASTSQREEADSSGSSVGEGGDEPSGMDSAEFGTTERDDWENGTERDDFDGIRETPGTSSSSGGDEDFEPQERGANGPSLQDHLRQQLLGMRLSAEDAAAVHVLIESLDEDGYLDGTLEDIAERVADSLGLDDPEERDELMDQLRCGLKWLQSMEPAGVGAANLGDCLCLQLRHRPAGPARDCAMAIARGHLELLARRDLRKLSAATSADEATVKAAQALIVGCEPKPGRPFAPAESLIIVPDVIVVKSGRNWKATLNPDVMPKLKVSELYAQAIRGQRGGGNLSARLQEARW